MITTINRAIAKKNEENDKGFTLIELLVVILIIGVLAAIAIPAFLNQREGAWKAQVESDVKNAALAVETQAVKDNGKYPAGTKAKMDDKIGGFSGTDEVTVEYTLVGNAYTLVGEHTQKTGATVTFTSSDGKTVSAGW